MQSTSVNITVVGLRLGGFLWSAGLARGRIVTILKASGHDLPVAVIPALASTFLHGLEIAKSQGGILSAGCVDDA